MGAIVEFSRRTAEPDSQPEQMITRRDVELSLAQSARTLISSLASLGESLRKADALICCIDDAEVRERARLVSESIHREILIVATRLLKTAALCQKEASSL